MNIFFYKEIKNEVYMPLTNTLLTFLIIIAIVIILVFTFGSNELFAVTFYILSVISSIAILVLPLVIVSGAILRLTNREKLL